MNKQSVKDMTVGSPFKLIMGFSLPLLLGLLFQQFYNMVDTAIVGKILGKSALAGVGSTGSVNFLIIGLCAGICNGFVIPVAQRFGAKDEIALKKYVVNSIYLAVILAAAITVSVSLLTRNILVWMSTPDNIFDYAYNYILVIFIGIPCTFLYNLSAGILRSLGDSKSPVIFLAVSSAMNIALDFLFIIPLKLGVVGAALATVVSQGISGILCVIYMIKKFPILRASKEERKFSVKECKLLLSMGLPMGLQYSITAIGSIVIQWAVNDFNSDDIIAGVTAAQKLNNFFFVPYDALGATMATYVGQNTGAKLYDRVKKGVLCASLIGFAYSLISLLVQFLFVKDLTLLFTDSGENVVIEYAYEFAMYSAIGAPLLVLVNVVRFSIQGMGYSSLAVLAGVMEMIARTFAGFFLKPQFGFAGVCMAHPLAWIFADAFLIPAFFICLKHLNKHFPKEESKSSLEINA